MAVACTLLASGGFVGAGYAGNSVADDAVAKSAVQPVGPRPGVQADPAAALDPVASPSLGVRISFAETLILTRKPKASTLFDLTNPNAKTPGLAQIANAMRAGIPEISPDLISKVRQDILAAAYQGLGHSYVWGGTSFATGWDCSGFVQWAYAQAGIALPRTEQWLPMMETNNPQPGDLVVQNPDGPNHWSHIGIYIGSGMMISALNPSVGTILHTPASTSSSSTYFTMPGFAAEDERTVKEKAAKDKSDKEKAALKAASSRSPDKSANPAPSETAKRPPHKTAQPTPSGTDKPLTVKSTPSSSPKSPGTTRAATGPASTPPATTPPATTPPPTSPAPETSTPAATTPPTTTTPATQTASPAGTTDPPETTATPAGTVPATPQATNSFVSEPAATRSAAPVDSLP